MTAPDPGLVTLDGNIWFDDGGDDPRVLTRGSAKGGFVPRWRRAE
jgi:hypothetical protein